MEAVMSKYYFVFLSIFIILFLCFSNFYFANADPGDITRISVNSDEMEADYASSLSSISANGLFIAFTSTATNLVEGEVNEFFQIYVRNITSGTTELISVSPVGEVGNGSSLNPSISADGRFIAFESSASNL